MVSNHDQGHLLYKGYVTLNKICIHKSIAYVKWVSNWKKPKSIKGHFLFISFCGIQPDVMHQSLVTTTTLHPGMTYADDSRNIEQNQVTARLVLFIELDDFHNVA